MKAITEIGQLLIGYTDEAGVCHTEFEMRLPTMADVDEAMEEAGENAIPARLSRYIWAKCLLRIGTVTEITPALLGGLADVEYNQFSKAELDIKKKRIPVKSGSSNSG